MPFSKVWSNVRTLLVGTGATQIVVVACTLMIGFLFTPGEFGRFIVFSTIALTVGSLAAVRYERAIVISRWDRTATAVSQVSRIVVALTTVCSLLVMLLLWAYKPFGIPEFEIFDLSAILITILVFGSYQIENQWLIRNEKFGALALAEFVGPAIGAMIQVIFGLCGWVTYKALLVGFVIGRILQLAAAQSSRPDSISFSFRRLRSVAFAFRAFPVVSTPYSLVSTGLNRGLLMISAVMLPAAIVGVLAMAQRLTYLPATTVASAIRRVFVRRLATGIGTKSLALETVTIFRIVLVLVIPIVLFIVFLIPFVFTKIAGDEWKEIGVFVLGFSPAAASLLLTSWLDRIYEIKRMQHLAFFLEAVSTLFICSVFYLLLRYQLDETFAVGVFGFLVCVYNIIWLVITLKVANMPSAAYLGRVFILFLILLAGFSLILIVDAEHFAYRASGGIVVVAALLCYVIWEALDLRKAIGSMKFESVKIANEE